MPQQNRREFLTTMTTSMAALAMASPGATHAFAAITPRTAGIRFGTQLNAFPIKPNDFGTFLSAVDQARQIGFQGFEAGFRFLQPQFASPEMARTKIEATGLTFFGIHIFLADAGYDQQTRVAPQALYEEVAKGGASLGAKHLILSGLPALTADGLKLKIDNLNKAGAFAKSAGLKLAYHNHWPEAESKLGEMEALYTQTNPELVSFVLDCGHAFRGGLNVPAFIRKHSHRIAACHLRDYKHDASGGIHLTTLGTGDLPLKQIADTLKAVNWNGWAETEEEREDHAQTGAEVLVPAYKAMKEAFTS